MRRAWAAARGTISRRPSLVRWRIPWDANDGEPVDLIILPAAPTETLHLLALARLSRLLRRDRFTAELRHARSPRRVIEVFRSWAQRLDGAPSLVGR